MANSYNFSILQGSELDVRLKIISNSAAVDLSGFLVRGHVKRKYSDTGTLIDLAPTIVTGTQTVDYPLGDGLPSGFIDIYLSGSQTAALPVAEAVYDIERYTTGEGPQHNETAVIKMLAGKFTINPEVTN